METELKYRALKQIKAGMLERIDWSPYELGKRETHHLNDTLLDTKDRVITEHRYGLRIRHDGKTIYLTLKGPGDEVSGARHRREEWQVTVEPKVAADSNQWPDEIKERVDALTHGHKLRPLIQIENRRRTWTISRKGQIVAELALDRGEIRAVQRRMALHEIEVELKDDGASDDLEGLAERLRQALPLADEPQTKLERGLLLLQEVEGSTEVGDAPDVPMTSHAPLAEAGRTVLRSHWKTLDGARDGVRDGDHEAVHDMRVSTRRLRAMLEVLTPVYKAGTTEPLRKGLKRLAKALGVVRDVEVWLENVEAYAQSLPANERPGLDPLLSALHSQRDAGRIDLLRELDAKHTRRLLHQVERFVKTEGAGVCAAAIRHGSPLRVRDIAGSALWARLEEVQAFDPFMPAAPIEVLHELRIACKHLRYTLELFDDTLGKAGKSLQRDLVGVQDQLGELHDADVALPFVEQLLAEQPGLHALQTYHDYLQARRSELLSRTTEIWALIGNQKFRGRLARRIADL